MEGQKQEIQADLQEYRKMVNASKDSLTLVDRQYIYRAVNDAYLSHKKILRKDMIGKTIADLWGMGTFMRFIKPFVDRAFSGEVANYQSWIDFNEKERKYMNVTYWPFREDSGEVSRVVVSSNDITQLKLTEMELVKSLNVAEAASKSKSQFLARMSHELRTPMHGVMSYIDFLNETELSNEQKEHFSQLQKSTDLLFKAINDILDFSSLHDGEFKIENICFNLKNTILDAFQSCIHLAQEKGVHFDYLISSNFSDLYKGDPGRIKQVLFNLVHNAIKFTNSGGEVQVKVEKVSNAISFSVVDSGIGIDEQKIENLFEAFEQGDGSKSRSHEGIGLGLSISNKLIQRMNGKLSATRNKGKGSTFSFELPVQVEPKQTKKAIEDHSNIKNVIYIKNETDVLETLPNILKSWNIECLEIHSLENLEIEEKNSLESLKKVDLVIINKCNQIFKNIKAIKEKTWMSDKPIVVLSHQGVKGEAKAIFEEGASAYFTMPFAGIDLKRCFQQLQSKSITEILTKHSVRDAKDNEYKVLIAEDNPLNQKIIVRTLQKAGFEPEIANNGLEAVQAFEKLKKFRFVLMDLRMPTMDGLEATQKIRGMRNGKKIPILALTADVTDDIEEQCYAVGMNGFMSKPYKKEQLLQYIEEKIF